MKSRRFSKHREWEASFTRADAKNAETRSARCLAWKRLAIFLMRPVRKRIRHQAWGSFIQQSGTSLALSATWARVRCFDGRYQLFARRKSSRAKALRFRRSFLA